MDEGLKTEVDALRADLKQLRDDLIGLTKTLRQKTAREAAEGIDGIKQKSEQLETQLRHAATEAKSTLEQQVTERPLGSLLIAFGVGLLFGKVFGRD